VSDVFFLSLIRQFRRRTGMFTVYTGRRYMLQQHNRRYPP
jgi:hypothetical protein